jgi:cytoskeletal protein RodZ
MVDGLHENTFPRIHSTAQISHRQEKTMIACKKFFLRSLTPILACSLLGGIGFATAANAQATTSTQTAPMTAAQQKAAKKAAKKEAKKEAAQQKATETKPAPMTKTEAKPATPMAKTSSETKTTHRSTMAPTTTQASSGDIASAKAKGMVWVNTESKVYHTGGKYYGNTKHGQFMSAADAQKAGYKEAKR